MPAALALALVDRGVEATELPDVVKAGVIAGVGEGVCSPPDVGGVEGWAGPVLRRFAVLFFG